MVARLAVGLGLALEEVLGTELELTVAAREVLGVPSLAQCCYDLQTYLYIFEIKIYYDL